RGSLVDVGKRCTDSDGERQLFLDIATTVMQGLELRLSPKSQRHLEECDKCRELFPLYVENGKAAYENKKYYRVVEEAGQGNPAVLRRFVAQGLALFKAHEEGGSTGIVVIVDPEHHSRTRRIYTNMTLNEFQEL